jgi:predicted kinase
MDDTQTRADAQLLREVLGNLPEPCVTPTLIAVSGLPGSGKSHLCRRLAERLQFPVLESDAMRRLLFPEPNHSRDESERLFRACHTLIEELLRRGIPLIFDATNLIERHRERLYRIADTADARLIIIRVEAPPEVVKKRLDRRRLGTDAEDNSEADWEIYLRMSATSQRIRRKHFAVDTSRDISPVVDKIVHEVNR